MIKVKSKKKPMSTSERYRRDNKVCVLLGIPREENEKIKIAAKIEGRSKAQFIMWHAIEAAKKIEEV